MILIVFQEGGDTKEMMSLVDVKTSFGEI